MLSSPRCTAHLGNGVLLNQATLLAFSTGWRMQKRLPSTTVSLPRTPTASVPLLTASRAYSTWNLSVKRSSEHVSCV